MTFIIGIAGPTCSGKTSVCRKILEKVKYAEYITLDDFLVDKKQYPFYKGYVNMDSPKGVKFDELYDVFLKIKKGEPTQIPIYDKKESKVAGSRNMSNDKEIIISEGFLLFHNKDVRSLLDLKIYLDLPVEKQKERRIKRGVYCDISYFDNVVVPMFKKYIVPSAGYADFILNADIPLDNLTNKIMNIFEKERVFK